MSIVQLWNLNTAMAVQSTSIHGSGQCRQKGFCVLSGDKIPK